MAMVSYSQLLITGGSGFLGWNLAKYAVNMYDVYFTYSQHPLKIQGCQEYHLNLQDPVEIEEVVGEIHPDVIIHAAALADVNVCEKRRSMAHDINVRGTTLLAQYAEEIGARFVYISTDLIFDGKQGNYTEEDIPKPCNYYADTKFQGEKVVRETLSDYLIIRMALLYGNSNGDNSCFTDWIRKGLEQQKPVQLYADQYRTPLYIGDGVRALLELLEKPATNQIFHVGGKERLNRYDFGKKFAEIFDYNEQYLHSAKMQDIDTAVKRGNDCSLNSQKIQKVLSFQLSNVKAGLHAMKQNRDNACSSSDR